MVVGVEVRWEIKGVYVFVVVVVVGGLFYGGVFGVGRGVRSILGQGK